jgi:hypothetical protein
MLAEAIASLQQTLYRANPRADLTQAEAAALERAGFEIEPDELGMADPLARTAAEYAALLKTSLSTAEMAARLGVDSSRIRQRLSAHPPSLYGIRLESGWCLPDFQLDGDEVLPGFGQVVAKLDRDLHPVAIYRWFTTENVDLVSGLKEAATLSPRDWLRLGFQPERAAELAAEL